MPRGRGTVEPVAASPEVRALAERLPSGVYLGTSTWSFPGWRSLVYQGEHSERTLARDGLAAYAAHPLLRAVGIDRTYYAPVAATDFAAYAAQVSADFRFVVKAHEALTVARYPEHPRYGARAGRPNDLFLHAGYAVDEVVGPYVEGLGEKAGVLVFQFPPQELGSPLAFVERLFAWLQALPRGPRYAVEVRNREVLTPHYALALADAGVSPCFTVHPRMPSLGAQWRSTLEVSQAEEPTVVVRWNLQRGESYGSARSRFAPFDRLVEEDPPRRRGIAKLVGRAVEEGWPAFVTVNNKAEGSAPLSVVKLAAEVAAQLG